MTARRAEKADAKKLSRRSAAEAPLFEKSSAAIDGEAAKVDSPARWSSAGAMPSASKILTFSAAISPPADCA